MRLGLTLFLKIVIILLGIFVLALGIFGFFWLIKNRINPYYAKFIYPILIGIYVSVIPFFAALYQAFKLLMNIDKKQTFTEFSVNALKNIKLSAMTISVLYMVILPFIYLLADLDDAPGLIIIGMIPILASMVCQAFFALFQRLLKEAIDIISKDELKI